MKKIPLIPGAGPSAPASRPSRFRELDQAAYLRQLTSHSRGSVRNLTPPQQWLDGHTVSARPHEDVHVERVSPGRTLVQRLRLLAEDVHSGTSSMSTFAVVQLLCEAADVLSRQTSSTIPETDHSHNK